jgi:hypothetical protein
VLNSVPSFGDVALGGIGLSDAHPQCEFIVQARVRQIQLSTRIQAGH